MSAVTVAKVPKRVESSDIILACTKNPLNVMVPVRVRITGERVCMCVYRCFHDKNVSLARLLG